MMTWNDITVDQFQRLEKVFMDHRSGVDDIDVDFETLLICYGYTEDQGNSLTTSEYKKHMKALSFLNEEKLEFKPVRHTTIGNNRYRFIYDIRDIRAHQYIEAVTFEGMGVTANMHRIAASMVVPQKKTLFGWRDVPHDSAYHDLYAEDMRQASLSHVHGSVVFFCKVFADSMTNLRSYLREEMRKTGMSEEKIEAGLTHLCSLMDGVIKQA